MAVSALSMAGVSLQDWVFIATLIYMALLTGHLIFFKILGLGGRDAKD